MNISNCKVYIVGVYPPIAHVIITIIAKRLTKSLCFGPYSRNQLPEGVFDLFVMAFEKPLVVNEGCKECNLLKLIHKLSSQDTYGDLVFTVLTESAISLFFSCKEKGIVLEKDKLLRSFFMFDPGQDSIASLSNRINAKFQAAAGGDDND